MAFRFGHKKSTSAEMLFIRSCFIESVPQAADGHYIYAILPTVGIIPGARQNHKKRRRVHLISVNFSFH